MIRAILEIGFKSRRQWLELKSGISRESVIPAQADVIPAQPALAEARGGNPHVPFRAAKGDAERSERRRMPLRGQESRKS